MDEKLYYDYQPLLSFGAYLNICIGERGVGKSYGAKKLVIKDYLKNGNQFIYMRRYMSELDTAVPTFFDDINANKEFDVVLKVRKRKQMSEFYIERTYEDEKGKEKKEAEIIGYAVALSTSNILKSTSFPSVRTIIFDEFLLTKGNYHYLRDEVPKFLDVLETVFRLRDNARVLMLANASDAYNPYMSYFDLTLPYNSQFKTFKNGEIVVNYIANEKYRAKKKKSRFGTLIQGTDYEKYAVDNQWFNRPDSTFVRKKGALAKNRYVFHLGGVRYGVWVDRDGAYISHDFDPQMTTVYAFDISSMNDETQLVQVKKSMCWYAMYASFSRGYLYFESIEIKEKMLNFFEKLI